MILEDSDPLPLFGLKLLSAIVERNADFFLPLLKQHFDLIGVISEYYNINHARLNRHTIKIMKCIIESKQTSFEDLAENNLIEKTHLIIKNMLSNKQEWCIETLLDIIHELLS